MDICIQIGNSDNKLTQQRWSEFILDIEWAIKYWSDQIYFSGFSRPDALWQNACWVFNISHLRSLGLKEEVMKVRLKYDQDSIAWSELTTGFI